MPGLRADLAVLEDLKDIRVAAVYKDGVLTAKEGVCLGAGRKRTKLCSRRGAAVCRQGEYRISRKNSWWPGNCISKGV